MRKIVPVFLALSIFGSAAFAQTVTPIIDYQGNAWETGGIPPSNPGDIFSIAAVVDALDPIFAVNLATTELTLWVTNLQSTGQVDIGGGFLATTFVGGDIQLWDDPSKNRSYGINPPNATVPSTFTDGTLFLGGILTSFILFYDTSTGSGAYEGNIIFNAGSALSTVTGIQGDGFTFGAVLDTQATGGNVPEGYDFQIDGVIEVTIIVAVEKTTWGQVKSLYNKR
jgi:hypothetical protein